MYSRVQSYSSSNNCRHEQLFQVSIAVKVLHIERGPSNFCIMKFSCGICPISCRFITRFLLNVLSVTTMSVGSESSLLHEPCI
jgi:hypothetical protein